MDEDQFEILTRRLDNIARAVIVAALLNEGIVAQSTWRATVDDIMRDAVRS